MKNITIGVIGAGLIGRSIFENSPSGATMILSASLT